MGYRVSLAGLVTVCYLAWGGGGALADGCPPQTCGTTGSQPPGSGLVFVRPSGQQGPLVAYTAATGAERFRIGNGLLSADGSRFVTVGTAKKGVGRRLLTMWDITRRARVVGRWAFAEQVWPAAVSADGYRIVLQERSRRDLSRFAVFDAARGRVLRHVTLRGAYQAEALSPDARRLYLLHWTNTSYDLRTFDFVSRRLRPTRLAEPDEKMTGNATIAVGTRDGRWLLTLYVGAEPFVHALDLKTGIAHCIDLPWTAAATVSAGTAAPALSPDGRKLYLANPLLGRLAVVDLRRLRVVRNIRFKPLPRNTAVFGAWPAAAVSPRGRMLAFGGARLVWLYDTAQGVIRGPFAAADAVPARTGIKPNVTALGFAAGGSRFVALSSDRSHRIFGAATGRRLGPRVVREEFTISTGVDVVGYASTGGPRWMLPPGHLSADGSSFFAGLPRSGGSTAIERYSPTTGAYLGRRVIAGRWTLGAVSPSATTIALARHARGTTWLRLLDTGSGRTIEARTLRGVFTLDAVNDDGRTVFLIQHYGGRRYAVRALDFARDRLWTPTLREKGQDESPVLSGRAAGQVASRDGAWLLTLYLDTRKRIAFVHALDLRRAAAVCIDLPGRAPLRRLRGYTLTVAGHRVLAVNPALGVIAHVDLRREAATFTRRFRAADGGSATGALTANGRRLYFASGRNVWTYDVTRRRLRGPRVAPLPIVGFGFGRDGRRVYAARSDGSVVTVDTRNRA